MHTRRHLLIALPATLAASLTTVALSGCASTETAAPDPGLKAALDAPHRSAANRARDVWRHPLETLQFFGLRPTHTVVELQPGGGWYSEILAPYLRAQGRYFAASFAADSTNNYQRRGRAAFAERMAKAPEVYGGAVLGTLPGPAGFTDIAPPGGADLVLTFRNVHNWVEDGSLDATLRGCFALLKPGGVLGVVDHRAAPGTALEAMKKSGYVTEALMEERANGVWALPPTFAGKDVERERFAAIGESDRFTHRYVKPRG